MLLLLPWTTDPAAVQDGGKEEARDWALTSVCEYTATRTPSVLYGVQLDKCRIYAITSPGRPQQVVSDFRRTISKFLRRKRLSCVIIGIFTLIWLNYVFSTPAAAGRRPIPRHRATAPSPTHTAALAIPGERTGVVTKFGEQRLSKLPFRRLQVITTFSFDPALTFVIFFHVYFF